MKNNDIEIRARVVVVESLGSEKIIYTDFNNQELIIRDFSNIEYRVDECIGLFLDVDKIFLFDPDTGLRLE